MAQPLTRETASAPVRGHFAAMHRHPAPVRGENARMKQQIEEKNNMETKFYQEVVGGYPRQISAIRLLRHIISL